MQSARRARIVWRSGLVLLVTVASWCSGDSPAAPKPSSFAPAADLKAQIDALVKQLGADLTDATEYGDEQKSRVAKDANTLIALAQVAANHDQDHALRQSAAAIVAASRKLASAAGELTSAKTALVSLTQAVQSTQGGLVSWEPKAELAQLMKQVPIVNNKLRAGVTGKRFDRTIDQNAALATTLAAIAHVSQFDTAYCSSNDEESTWAKICADMRNAAVEVQSAVRKKDQTAAKVGLDKLVKTCDACHADFRD